MILVNVGSSTTPSRPRSRPTEIVRTCLHIAQLSWFKPVPGPWTRMWVAQSR